MALPEGAQLRHPRAFLTINDEAIPGLLDVEIDSNNFYAADTFRATVSLGGANRPWSFWTGNDEMRVRVSVELDGEGPKTLFIGLVDNVVSDPVNNLISIDGRDLTAALIDNRTTEKWMNFRSHRVVEVLAKKHGLKAVTTQSKNRVGSFFGDEDASIKSTATQWDLISYLAQQEGRRLFVEGDTLYWVDPKDVPQRPYPLVWSGYPATIATSRAQVTELRFERNLTLAGDVEVVVQSYNAEDGETFTKKAKVRHRRRNGRGRRRGETQTFVRTIPNLTPERAQQRAQSLLREISQHEVRLFFSAPADNDLSPTSVVRVSGTGTDYDQDYYPDSIVRVWSWDQGYVMRVRAKNSLPVDEVLL